MIWTACNKNPVPIRWGQLIIRESAKEVQHVMIYLWSEM